MPEADTSGGGTIRIAPKRAMVARLPSLKTLTSGPITCGRPASTRRQDTSLASTRKPASQCSRTAWISLRRGHQRQRGQHHLLARRAATARRSPPGRARRRVRAWSTPPRPSARSPPAPRRRCGNRSRAACRRGQWNSTGPSVSRGAERSSPALPIGAGGLLAALGDAAAAAPRRSAWRQRPRARRQSTARGRPRTTCGDVGPAALAALDLEAR